MTEPVYYNEIDEYAAKWLQHLINAGLIAAGIVDTRSIEDVTPNDLIGFKQCHFFAGIGGWSLALRRAGWPDSRSVWTASCPCQPFSAAGAGGGFADERHLWPCLDFLISERRPAKIFGEQVASGLVGPWIDLVHADLEAMGYAFGCVPFPSAGVGAPHIRDRNYWVADADGTRSFPGAYPGIYSGQNGVGAWDVESKRPGAVGSVADADSFRPQGERGQPREQQPARQQGFGENGTTVRPGPTNGFWRAADWLGCTDAKWRPVEPGTFPLADGLSRAVGRVRADQAERKDQGSRTGRLKGYGNAINVEAAAAFIIAASC